MSRALFALTLLASASFGTGLQPLSIDDVDGDARADLVVATNIPGRQLMAVSSRDDQTLWIYTPQDDDTSKDAGDRSVVSPPRIVVCSDRDGDGARDIAAVWRPRLDGEHVLVNVHSSCTGRVLASTRVQCERPACDLALVELGDLDGDSSPDLLLGIPAENGIGVVLAISGRDSGTREFARGSRTGEQFGYALEPIGDLDGDGVNDVAVGSPGPTIECAGAITIVSGRSGESLRIFRGSDLSSDSQQCAPGFGWTFAAARPLDRHAPSNLWVVVPANKGRATDALTISTETGSVLARVRLVDIEIMDMLALQLTPAGDWDGDGLGDVILRDAQWNRLGPNESFVSDIGHVRIVGERGELDRWEGQRAKEYLGMGVSPARDHDASGSPMVWIASRSMDGSTPVVSRYARGAQHAHRILAPTRNALPEVAR